MLLVVLFCVLSNLQSSSQHAPVNIARGLEASYRINRKTYNLTDGLFDFITIVSDRGLYITVDLDIQYFIHYVILYCDAGSTEDNSFDYFEVTLLRMKIAKCGTYHAKLNLTSPLNGYRVNCKNHYNQYYKVIFTAGNSRILTASVSEVSIYTFGMFRSPDELYIYLGCYTDSHAVKKFEYLDIRSCAHICRREKFNLMAVKESPDACHCGTKTNGNRITENNGSQCNITCESMTYKCGGSSVYSVYLINFNMPTVELCTDEKNVHDQYGGHHILMESGISKCIRHCSGYLYAFLSERQCSCVNQSLINVQNKQCDFACSSNANEACGPGYVFFSTCEHSDNSYMNCDDLFKCSSDVDMFLSCDSCIDSGLDEQYALPFCIGFGRPEVTIIGTIHWQRTTTTAPVTAAPGTATPGTAAPGSAAPRLSTASRATNVNGDKESTSKPDTENGTLGKGDSVVFVRVVITSLFIAYFAISMID